MAASASQRASAKVISFEVHSSEDFSYPGIKRKRLPGEPRMKPGPRPTKRPRKYQPRKAPTRLRKDRPLQTEISQDIWENILIFCPLDKLLKIRFLCKAFYETLKSNRVWKQARINQFGRGLPDPPMGMNEVEYADLLVAVGCQTGDCEEKNTRRTYWAFRRRWCEKCCGNKLIKERIAKTEIDNYEKAKKCIPYAMYDSWNHYQWAGHYEEPPAWTGTYGAQTPVFSKHDLKKFKMKFDSFNENPRTEEEIDAWFSEQELTNHEYVEQLQKIEAWLMEDGKAREKERAEIKQKRAGFFKAQALQMDPPLAPEALENCNSYEKSIQIAKAPSEKSWRILHDKLINERIEAEKQAAIVKRRAWHTHYRQYLMAHHTDTLSARRYKNSPEQRLVLRLADQVIYNVLTNREGFREWDIVNVILRNVYDAFQKIPDDDKPTNPQGPYRLIMDDARLVYTDRIEPLIQMFPSPNRRKRIYRLYCPSDQCECSDANPHEFHELIEKHYSGGHYNNDVFDHFSAGIYHAPLNGSSPTIWYCREWPRNLPFKAKYQPAPNRWNSDDETLYEPRDRPGQPLIHEMLQEIWQHKSINWQETIVRAAQVLQGMRIGTCYQSSIAIEYLVYRYGTKTDDDVSLFDANIAIQILRQRNLLAAFSDQHCIRCQQNGVKGPFSHQPHSFDALLLHYMNVHMGAAALAENHEILVPCIAKLEGEGREANQKRLDSLPSIRDVLSGLSANPNSRQHRSELPDFLLQEDVD